MNTRVEGRKVEAAVEPRQLEFLRRKDRSGERLLSSLGSPARASALSRSVVLPPPLLSTWWQENRALQPASANCGTRRYQRQVATREQHGARRLSARRREEGTSRGRETKRLEREVRRRREAEEEEEEEEGKTGREEEERTGDRVEASSVARRTRTAARPQPMSIAGL